METNRLRNFTIILMAVLLAVLYLASVTVEPVFARNETCFKPKTYDKGNKLDKEDKDKKDAQDDPIKIKSHPVLKVPPGGSSISTMSLSLMSLLNIWMVLIDSDNNYLKE